MKSLKTKTNRKIKTKPSSTGSTPVAERQSCGLSASKSESSNERLLTILGEVEMALAETSKTLLFQVEKLQLCSLYAKQSPSPSIQPRYVT